MKHASEFFKLSIMKQKKILKKVMKQTNDDQRETMQKAQKLCKVMQPYVQTQYRHQCACGTPVSKDLQKKIDKEWQSSPFAKYMEVVKHNLSEALVAKTFPELEDDSYDAGYAKAIEDVKELINKL